MGLPSRPHPKSLGFRKRRASLEPGAPALTIVAIRFRSKRDVPKEKNAHRIFH